MCNSTPIMNKAGQEYISHFFPVYLLILSSNSSPSPCHLNSVTWDPKNEIDLDRVGVTPATSQFGAELFFTEGGRNPALSSSRKSRYFWINLLQIIIVYNVKSDFFHSYSHLSVKSIFKLTSYIFYMTYLVWSLY